MSSIPSELSPPARLLLGPGPSPTSPEVLRALGKPTVGHLDPFFLGIMDEVRSMLRTVFGTQNELTFPMSGTGSAGMETCLVNLIEPGTRVLVGINGVFGVRMAEVARRAGAEVQVAKVLWGLPMSAEALLEAAGGQSFDLLCVVHAETSTGALSEIPPLRAVADQLGALLVLDCVTSIGGPTLELDAWGVDAAYAGTQKCLSCPPGLAPVSFSPRAQERLAKRKRAVQSWYLDLSLIANYWGAERAYHHTAPINMLYGLHEALRQVLLEGLPARALRHRLHASAFRAGCTALGLSMVVEGAGRLDPLTSVHCPEDVQEAQLRSFLLKEHNIEIGGGLGPMAGKIWRIGLMGSGSSRDNVERCILAMAEALSDQGFGSKGDALQAVAEVYAKA